MVFRPSSGTAESRLVVLGSNRLDAYAVDTGEPRWWMPLGSSGSMGTVVASGDTLFVSTIGSSDPALPPFDEYGEYYASPVAADGKVFLAKGEGKITVLKAAAQRDVLGVNDIGDEIHATPALSGGRIYVRTRGALYCFGAQ